MSQLKQRTSLGATNRSDLATIYAEICYKEAYLHEAYGTISKRLDDAKSVLFGQEVKHWFGREGEEFEAGVLRGSGLFLDKILKEVEAELAEEKKKLWSRVENENGIVVGPDEELGRWVLRRWVVQIPHEQTEEAMKKEEAKKRTYKDVKALFEAAEAESKLTKANMEKDRAQFLLDNKDQASAKY